MHARKQDLDEVRKEYQGAGGAERARLPDEAVKRTKRSASWLKRRQLMLFVIAWSFPPEKRDAVQGRFKETGGPPPQGVKMLGRWHGIGVGRGVCVAQSDDPVAISRWAQQWSDLMSFDVYPVLNDEDVVRALS